MKEGYIATFYVQDLGLAPATKTCPHETHSFTKVNNGQEFPQEESLFYFLCSRLQVPQRKPTKRFVQMFEDMTA